MFENNDIELLLAGDGAYDHLSWTTAPGRNYSGKLREIVSLHELAHDHLNTMTAYGNLMSLYSYLARTVAAQSELYKRILSDLVSRCRIAHEAYATWESITRFGSAPPNEDPEVYLAGYDSYKEYFAIAKNLVTGIAGSFFRQAIIGACFNICFQSRAIAEAVLRDFRNFSVSAVRNVDFPDARLRFILENFTAALFMGWLAEYAESKRDTPFHSFLQQELSGDANVSYNRMDEKFIQLSDELVQYIQEKLDQHLAPAGYHSYLKNGHLDFVRDLYDVVYGIYPEISRDELVFLPQGASTNSVRNVMLDFERETLLLRDEPLRCVVRSFGDLTPEIKEGLFQQSSVVLLGKDTALLRDQYIYPNGGDRDWLTGSGQTLTFCRLLVEADSEDLVILIPFLHPSELKPLLNEKPKNQPVCAAMYLSVMSDKGWLEKWGNIFYACDQWIFFNDISLLYVIENLFREMTNVACGSMLIGGDDREYAGLVFRFIADEDEVVMLVPCSDAHAKFALNYMEKFHPRYVLDQDTVGDHEWSIVAILSDVLVTEYRLSYSGALVADALFNPKK